jgi:hypothetical protein
MTFDPTPRSDYEHWNEERDLVWYQEVGQHSYSEPDVRDPDDWDLWDSFHLDGTEDDR